MTVVEKINNPANYRPDPSEIPLSHVSRANGFLFLMGIGARNKDGSLEGGDIRAQTRKCLENARSILAACNADFRHLVRVECFLTDVDDTAGFNEVYREYINDDPPARALLFIQGFRDKRMLVELVATAVDPDWPKR